MTRKGTLLGLSLLSSCMSVSAFEMKTQLAEGGWCERSDIHGHTPALLAAYQPAVIMKECFPMVCSHANTNGGEFYPINNRNYGLRKDEFLSVVAVKFLATAEEFLHHVDKDGITPKDVRLDGFWMHDAESKSKKKEDCEGNPAYYVKLNYELANEWQLALLDKAQEKLEISCYEPNYKLKGEGDNLEDDGRILEYMNSDLKFVPIPVVYTVQAPPEPKRKAFYGVSNGDTKKQGNAEDNAIDLTKDQEVDEFEGSLQKKVKPNDNPKKSNKEDPIVIDIDK